MRKNFIMNAKKFAWVYLIKNGYAGCKLDYYGGWELIDEQAKAIFASDPLSFNVYTRINEHYIKQIAIHGVNWEKTKEPESDITYEFNGTFNDPSKTEIINGKLVLNNGIVQSWAAPNIEVANVFEMMANIDESIKQFKIIFGE